MDRGMIVALVIAALGVDIGLGIAGTTIWRAPQDLGRQLRVDCKSIVRELWPHNPYDAFVDDPAKKNARLEETQERIRDCIVRRSGVLDR